MAVTGAQFEATVGNVNSGFPASSATSLVSSMARPPPIPNTMSAACTRGSAASLAATSCRGEPPYQIWSVTVTPVPSRAARRRGAAFSMAVLPPMSTAVVPKRLVTVGTAL